MRVAPQFQRVLKRDQSRCATRLPKQLLTSFPDAATELARLLDTGTLSVASLLDVEQPREVSVVLCVRLGGHKIITPRAKSQERDPTDDTTRQRIESVPGFEACKMDLMCSANACY